LGLESDPALVVRLLWKRFQARDWDGARELLDEDVEVCWVHTGERWLGRDAFIRVNREYPEGWSIAMTRIVAAGSQVVSEIVVPSPQGTFRAASFFEVRDGRIVRATEYWLEEGGEAPPRWRTGWAERS